MGQFQFYALFLGYFDPLKLHLKVMQPLVSLAPNRYELDLLNEVIKIHFGQGAAKIFKVKIGGPKKESAMTVVLWV